MKKITISLLLLLFLGFSSLIAETYPPEGWYTNFTEALEMAEQEDKYLLLNFTGSDWCIWCDRLESQVFSTDEFKEWAEDNAVLVFLDFPSSIALSEDQQMQNSLLQQFFQVGGYPTVWLVGSKREPLLATGYKDGGAENYINHLTNDRNVNTDMVDEFKKALDDLIKTYLVSLDL